MLVKYLEGEEISPEELAAMKKKAAENKLKKKKAAEKKLKKKNAANKAGK